MVQIKMFYHMIMVGLPDSPLGGNGEVVVWASMGNSLNLYYNQEIYFIDCARINASIIEIKGKVL